MDQGFRRGFTAAEKSELWDRWQRGESLKAIGRAFGKPSSSIYFQVSPHGGIRPTPRRRSCFAPGICDKVQSQLVQPEGSQPLRGRADRSSCRVSHLSYRRGGQSLCPRYEGVLQSQWPARAGRDCRETGLAVEAALAARDEPANERCERAVPADAGSGVTTLRA